MKMRLLRYLICSIPLFFVFQLQGQFGIYPGQFAPAPDSNYIYRASPSSVFSGLYEWEMVHKDSLNWWMASGDYQTLSWSSPNLSISDGNSVDLSSLLDNTDDQDLTLVGNTLAIENDPNTDVDLSGYLDNTDDQQLSIDSTGRVFTITLEDGSSVKFEDQGGVASTPTWDETMNEGSSTDNTATFTAVAAQIDMNGSTSSLISMDGSTTGITWNLANGSNGFGFYPSSTGGDFSIKTNSLQNAFAYNPANADLDLYLDETTPSVGFNFDGLTGNVTHYQLDGSAAIRHYMSSCQSQWFTAAGSFGAEIDGINASMKLGNATYIEIDGDDKIININGDSGTIGEAIMSDGAGGVQWTTPTGITQEQVEDYVGGMVTGNTETGIEVTYQDGDGTLDFVVSYPDLKVARYYTSEANTEITSAEDEIAFDDESYDPTSNYAPYSTTDQIQVSTTGYYKVTATLRTFENGGAATYVDYWFEVNDVIESNTTAYRQGYQANTYETVTITDLLYLVSGERIGVSAQKTGSASGTVYVAQHSVLTIELMN